MSESKFYVYSKNGCGFCDKLTNFMESKGVSYEKFNLGDDFSSEDFLYKNLEELLHFHKLSWTTERLEA